MKPVYLLDAMIVIELAEASGLEMLASGRVRIELVEEVWDEVTDKRHAGPARAVRRVLSGVTRRSIVPGSHEDRIKEALRDSPTSRRNLGEAASIAVASVDPDVVLVTNDRDAAFAAMRELRGRTIELFAFFRALIDAGESREAVTRVRASIAKRQHRNTLWTTPPTWWDT